MISKLNGIVDSAGSDWAVIDVGGVGYQVFCSARTLAALPSAGEAASLFTEMLVSETSIRLVGFSSAVERDWFRLLDQVQGVGTKVALSVLSTLSTSELASAIALKDLAMIARAPGVGKKVAERICNELRDKGPETAGADALAAGLTGPARAFEGPAADAVSALVNLGYAQARAAAAVAAAGRANGAEQSAEELIRRGLKELAR